MKIFTKAIIIDATIETKRFANNSSNLLFAAEVSPLQDTIIPIIPIKNSKAKIKNNIHVFFLHTFIY